MKQSNHAAMVFYAMGVAGIMMAVFFLLVIAGAGTYRSTVAGQAKNNRDRALVSYVLAAVKSGDAAGAVRVYDADGTPVVAVEEADSGYGVRIYQYGGKLLGDYGRLDWELNPGDALVIGETETFRVEDLGDATYRVTTDAGRALFHLRSKKAPVQE